MKVDQLFVNGDIHTFDPGQPRASTVAVIAGRIVAVGDDDLAEQFTADDRIDLGRRSVVPGFNDAHNHMVFFGMSLADVDCSSPPMRSVEDICEAIRQRAAETPAGGWVTGAGYDQNKLAEGRHPHARELDAAAPNHNVWLKHTSGHMCTVNTAVLDMIRETPVPDGGELGRDADGALDGLVMEQAQSMVRDLVYPLTVDRIVDAIDQASKRYLAEGVTSATEAGVGAGLVSHSPIELMAWMEARKRGVLGIRANLLVAVEALHHISHVEGEDSVFTLDGGIHSGLGDEWLRIGGTKIFSDGSLIGRTAAMFDPFEGGGVGECSCGFFQTEPEVLRRLIIDAHKSGWQVCTHAIGDRAVATVLDAYEEAQKLYPRHDTRHRIEHCGVLQEHLLDKVKALGVIPVPQGRFISEIGDGMKGALGVHRTPDAYRQRSFLDRGIPLPGSSDRPVVNGAPLLGIHDMVNQRTASGEPFVPEEAISASEAIAAYTGGSAYAAFEERVKGTISRGKLADFVVLGEDPLTIDKDGIGQISVDATIVGGNVAHDLLGIAN
ncbi:MAG: amidohydrolase [Actinomycetota bacterium]|nr:hydrolase [Acidimicrobiaceae bacterium]MEC8485618.1 amidohydrolase [Actinomycetota bacterium]MEC8502306.1 amidohydrolase [Actinomycetota bacterium]MEC8521619.1 amidohydrolase [Actinomycetota bacterium]MEC9224614.1 amidohydrolase [Actinomycetota bacterium]